MSVTIPNPQFPETTARHASYQPSDLPDLETGETAEDDYAFDELGHTPVTDEPGDVLPRRWAF